MYRKINKKGSLLDPLLIIIILFAFGFMAILGYKVSDSLNDSIQSGTALQQSQKDLVQSFHDSYISIFDIGFLVVFVLLFVGILIGSYLIDTSPVFLPIFLFLSIFLIILTAILGNVFYDGTTGSLAVERASFPIITFIMNNFLKIIIITILCSATIMYGKSRLNQ